MNRLLHRILPALLVYGLLVLGVAATLGTIHVSSRSVRGDIPVMIGASLIAVTLIALVAAELVPPSPSVSTKRTVRASVLGESETLA